MQNMQLHGETHQLFANLCYNMCESPALVSCRTRQCRRLSSYGRLQKVGIPGSVLSGLLLSLCTFVWYELYLSAVLIISTTLMTH